MLSGPAVADGNALTTTQPRQINVTPAMVDYAEPGVMGSDQASDDNLKRYLRYYEDSEEASRIAREKAERDRDYVDNKQLTDEEVQKLQKRGQPPIVLNVIRDRAGFLAGMEKKQRRDPKAYPRNNPDDVGAAEAFTDGMRYCVERGDYMSKRSQAWKNISIEGFGGIELAAVKKASGDTDFSLSRIPWDRIFYDPHSAEPDFSDARYLGQVMWMDLDEALARAVGAGKVTEAQATDILETTLSTAPGLGRTYDDKPKYTIWGDSKRKRVRIAMMWHKEADGWHYCEFTKAGILAEAPEPYVDQDGESYCPLVLESANVDRDNNRYGEVRHLIDPQDEVNKRRSKGLHLLNTRGVIADEGAVDDVNAARRELAKPDFWLIKNTGASLEIKEGTELAAGQAQLGAEAMAYIQQAGPNGAMMGKGVQDQSGKAIEAQQAGGLVQQSDLMDTLRRLDLRVFTILASMMKQFWDGPKWIRVTDDDDAPRWVGLNEPMWSDPATGQTEPESSWKAHFAQGGNPQDPDQAHRLQPAVDPQTGQPQLNNHVASLDMDIIVSDAPDTINLDGENYQAFLQLMQMKLPPSQMKLAIEMNPGLNGKRKKQLQDMIDQAAQAPPPQAEQDAQKLKIEKLEAEIVEVRSQAYLNLTAGETNMAKIGVSTEAVPVPDIAEGGFAGPMAAPGPVGSAPIMPPGPPGAPQGPAMPPGAPMPPRPMLPPPAPVTGPPAAGPGPILHPSSRPGDPGPAHAPGGTVGMMTGRPAPAPMAPA